MSDREFFRLGLELRALEGKPESFKPSPVREFHIARAVREKYSFRKQLFSLRGNVIFADFRAVQEFARAMNTKRDTVRRPERAVKAGQLNAMGLVDEILHHVVALYREKHGASLLGQVLRETRTRLGAAAVKEGLEFFVREFPPSPVYPDGVAPAEYLAGSTDGEANEEAALEEMLLLWLANDNPAFAPFGELFDDTDLRGRTAYLKIIAAVKDIFKNKPAFGPYEQTLVEMLKAPAVASPYSLPGQLEYIKKHWGLYLGDYLERLLKGLGFIKEEEKIRWGLGPGPTQVYEYSGTGYGDEETERFSPDKDWMPKLVLLAKSSLVWLDQLSRQYKREIRTLDGIPDEELDLLASRGITGLWLIGLWERSKASRRIKELCGNPDAAASAYSLYDYDVAEELGGWQALDNLRKRAWVRGIRLASDMVPNHTEIDSRWVAEHPEWFIQAEYPPFPGYSFGGENLSSRSEVVLQLEDHYYDRTDASVVFKRIDRPSGGARYIYHGNDGTHMPWNDTAQLNFLLPEVREAVIRTILHVAKNFPIIRFDAAMTLAKRHFQRLWYPEPGSGGDIPSRAERGLSKDEFNRLFPTEFWREVVDRAAEEAPDTLLLAEAFWMMEGYFVRTLGMHRVYNSAFMNMLKNEENAKYRSTVKNTQEFDRNILKRFVNFMNNPDEETAIAQFGDGDKYFGVCTLLATMPGLPMFGHGQIEGYREKYGMEYRRAYRDEAPDENLLKRHEREIFPLLKKRYLFAEVENFLLYDLFREDGGVNENLFAYSNRLGDEAALVLYNNSISPAWGWIKASAACLEKRSDGEKGLVQKSLGEALGLSAEENAYCLFREQRSGLWFLRRSRELLENGLFLSLKGYECQVFLDFYQLRDDGEGSYRRLADALGGAGMESVEGSLRDMRFRSLYDPFRVLVDGYSRFFAGEKLDETFSKTPEFLDKCKVFLAEANKLAGGKGSVEKASEEIAAGCAAALRLRFEEKTGETEFSVKADPAEKADLPEGGLGSPAEEKLFFTFVLLRGLGRIGSEDEREEPLAAGSLATDWGLDQEFEKILIASGTDPYEAGRIRLLLTVLLTRENWFDGTERFGKPEVGARVALEALFDDPNVRTSAGLNRFENELYFNREGFLVLLVWLRRIALIRIRTKTLMAGETVPDESEKAVFSETERWHEAFGKADYLLERLFEALDPPASESDLEER